MNTTKIKSFAEYARRTLLEQTSAKLKQILPEGSLARRESPDAMQQLDALIRQHGEQYVIEQAAYTWFNRFCALRYMDVNGYHSPAVLSPLPGQSQPEILAEAKMGVDIDLAPKETSEKVYSLLSGTTASNDPQGEAYRLLIVAACNHWHRAMPFMFEQIADYTELLMPDDLLSGNSILAYTREAMTEEVCQDVEVIGWLYQFYISEKKDEVIGKVVKSEDIPAATQLFTPNWIVKYMVQNSLGAQWLATYPESSLKQSMEYYIEPAEQTEEVQAQLAAITPESLDPESLTLIDPACGSGHILVEAYEVLKAIYLERGYRQRDVAQLILEKNLYGLDIDERAAQLTGFALMMKARADDRRLFTRGVKLNIMALVDSTDFDAESLGDNLTLSDHGLELADVTALKRLFENATTFGSLIQVPQALAEKLPTLRKLSEFDYRGHKSEAFLRTPLKQLQPLVRQAEMLAAQYDAVVANPPYMGGKGMNPLLKKLAKDHFPDAKSDLFACFIERGYTLAKDAGYNAMVTMQSWMFLSSYEKMRERMLSEKTITSMLHMDNMVMRIAFGTAVTILRNHRYPQYKGSYCYVEMDDLNKKGEPSEFPPPNERNLAAKKQAPKTLEAIQNRTCGWFHEIAQDEFKKIPGSPVAYWLSSKEFKVFDFTHPLGANYKAKTGMRTGDNERFLRMWYEPSRRNLGLKMTKSTALSSGLKWFPYNKGGGYQKWYGNNELVVNWENDGLDIKDLTRQNYPQLGDNLGWKITNEELYFQDGITWGGLTSAVVSFRWSNTGALFDSNKGAMLFPANRDSMLVLGLLNSKISNNFLKAINPTLSTQNSDINTIPTIDFESLSKPHGVTKNLVNLSKSDWDAYERSWDFQSNPILATAPSATTLESAYTAWLAENRSTIAEMKRLEEENNRLFIDAYGLTDELTPDVPIEQITLTINPAYRYGVKISEEARKIRFRQDTMKEFVSYAVGCMFGRYSLDAPGLIYANSGNEGFDPSRYTTFPADDDNVIPILDGEWFSDDIVERFKTFLKITFGNEHYEENLRWLEDGLFPANLEGKKRKGIRDYFLKNFYADHVQTYKKRPIYWMFSSPKGSFNALIYLHRYRPDTVSIVLNDYLREFKTKLRAKLENLEHLETSSDASKKDKATALKEIARLKKVLTELDDWERDVLYPLATQQIALDLDDGVKVNYNKLKANKGLALKKITGLTEK